MEKTAEGVNVKENRFTRAEWKCPTCDTPNHRDVHRSGLKCSYCGQRLSKKGSEEDGRFTIFDKEDAEGGR